MTSAINTGAIDPNFPAPGVNNNSQGFRTNFGSIQQNLDTAATEITDLQSKAILKSALTGTTLNNDMANALISNALVQGFRSTTYNLGTNLSGTVTIDATKGDVQYGTITGNTTLQFAKWAPAGTQSNVETIFTIANASAVITLPTNVTDGASTLAYYQGNGVAGGNLSIPPATTQLHYVFSTIDCGSNVEMNLVDNVRAVRVEQGTPNISNVTATGTITANTNSNAVVGVGTLFSSELVVGRVLTSSANVYLGTVKTITDNTNLVLTANANIGANITGANYRRQLPIGQSNDVIGDMKTDGTYLYLCTATYAGTANATIWSRITPSSY